MTDDTGATAPAGPDPWRSFRGVMAGTLVLEAIVVLLALPVVAVVGGGLTVGNGIYLVGLAVVLIGLAGLQGRRSRTAGDMGIRRSRTAGDMGSRWAIWVNLAMQLVVIAGVVVHPAIGFIGAIFAAVWLLIAYLRGQVLRRQKRGLLPGQQAGPD
jgi:hypothetical protein